MRSRPMKLIAILLGVLASLAGPLGADDNWTIRNPSPDNLRGLARSHPASDVRKVGEILPDEWDKNADLALKNNGLDLLGSVSASWGASGVRIQVDRIVNTAGSTSPPLLLRLWATSKLPVFGDSLYPNILGSFSLGTLPSGGEIDNADTGYLTYSPPPAGCYYVTVALETAKSDGSYTYWSFATLEDSTGNDRFGFGSSECVATPAQAGGLYATGNSSDALLYRVDDFATNPHAIALGRTGLVKPTIAIDPISRILYALDVSDGNLYKIDAQTGKTDFLGSSGLASVGPVALAFNSVGNLFTWGHNDGRLYSLNKATAQASLIGNTGYVAGGDLAFDLDGTLYGSTGTSLIRIDSRTGTSTYIGAFGVDGIYGLAVAPDGTLYAGQDESSLFSDASRLYRVNKTTALLTLAGEFAESLGDLALGSGGGAPPAPVFSWSPAAPTTGQAVQFTGQASGSPTSWRWDFDGNGTTDSVAQSPTRTYANAGTYAVTLTACNAAGCGMSTRSLVVLSKPVIQVTGPASGTALQALAFTATASGCTPNPFTWSWKSDGDLINFDSGLWPPSGIFPLASPTALANLGWSSQGSHSVRVVNTSCPGAEGVATVSIQFPKDQSAQIFPKALDRSLPTVVFCHGLQVESFDQSGKNLWSCVGGCNSSKVDHPAGDLPASKTVNKVQYIWSGAGQGKTDVFAIDYIRAWEYTDDAGRQLANQLVAALGGNYDRPIQFVGHSLGSVVCGRAAVEFLKSEPKIAQLQLTVLDRPDHVGKLLHQSPYPNFEARFGFAEDYFPSLLAAAVRPGLELRLDNYWSSTGTGSGDVTKCLNGVRVYNHRKPAGLLKPGSIGNRYFRDESIAHIDIDHSGVHQWYRWTGAPNGVATAGGDSQVCSDEVFTSPRGSFGGDVFNSSLSPCEAGWGASLVGPSPASFPTDAVCDPASVHPEPVPVCIGVGTSCLAIAGRVLATSEAAAVASTERAGTVAVAIPGYGRNLLFTLEVLNPGTGSSAVVLLDSVPLWSGSLVSFPAKRAVEIGPLPLYGLTGNHMLTLKVLGPTNTAVRLSNLQIQKILVPCTAGNALCITAHRFRIEADWTDPQGNSGHATPRAIDSDASGFMWFFDQSNLELIVKVLNACGFTGSPRFWVYAAGLTDVEVRLTITDTVTGTVKIYTNPKGVAFQPIQDTDAFATCRPGDALAASTIAAPPPVDQVASLAKSGLDQGRFTVAATWRTPDGQSAAAQFVPVTDNSGYFWFFDPGNVEIVVKVLDGCGLNNRFWVYAAGLTNVQVDLIVTDSKTGTQVSYHNAQGQGFQPIQDTNAFATCP